jgi:hypothetical protein
VQERVVVQGVGASTIEAVQADIETGGVVDAIETLCAVFSIDRLRGEWRSKLRAVNVNTGHGVVEYGECRQWKELKQLSKSRLKLFVFGWMLQGTKRRGA